MNTPICDFVKEYSEKNSIRLHMPGHKGLGVLGPECLDITEISGADVLYHPEGIIRESEENAAALFGSARTVYSTEGSSLCIRAMLFLIRLYAQSNGRRAKILAGRNAHKTFITAAALLDIEVEWIYSGEEELISCSIEAEKLENMLKEKKPDAVYITSPDYLGNVADIAKIAQICKRYGCLLAVDNAHGAYLRFLEPSQHPMDLGADICCDSAHKTLPVLTGGAYLHISANAPSLFAKQAERAFSMFASTSPSYLIMQSLDMANKILAETFAEKVQARAARVEMLKESLRQQGFALAGTEELKLTIVPKSYGYTGTELAAALEEKNIFVEFSDPDYVVMMFSPESSEKEIDLLQKVLQALPRRAAIENNAPGIRPGKKKMSLQEAMMAEMETVLVSKALGRVLAAADVACPPAIPIAICGEELDQNAIKCLEYYGISRISVVKVMDDEKAENRSGSIF